MKQSIKLFRNKVLVALLMRLQGIQFPVRQLGGNEWVNQWRLNFLTNSLEKESVTWCQKLIRPGMVVVDIGAHIGYYTRLFSRLVGKSGRVFAFEPCSENYPVLTKNLSAKEFQNVTLFNKAVGVEDAQGTLFISPGHSNHSLNRGFTESVAQEQIEMVSLDSVFRQQGFCHIDFIKMDVEGFEINVLNGMKEVIANSPNLSMLVEYNPAALRSGNFEPVELLALVERMGFEAQRILSDTSLSKNISPDMQETFNLLCIHPNLRGFEHV